MKDKNIQEKHKKMLALQERIKPFTPTIRELEKEWGLYSTSQAHSILKTMVENNLVIVREAGKSKHYYAVSNGIHS